MERHRSAIEVNWNFIHSAVKSEVLPAVTICLMECDKRVPAFRG